VTLSPQHRQLGHLLRVGREHETRAGRLRPSKIVRGAPLWFRRDTALATRVRGNRFFLRMGYRTDPGEAETVRIARGVRWVRR
jgi:hypothetical protein